MPDHGGKGRVNSQGARARDNQRSRLYTAEGVLSLRRVSVPARLLVDTERHSYLVKRVDGKSAPVLYPHIDACQAYVDSVVARAWFVRRWGTRRIHVRANSGTSAGGGVISLGAAHRRSEAVILHELAHLLQPSTSAHHGPEFAGILLTLVKHVMGAEHAADLRDSYKANRVRHTLSAAGIR